MHKYHTLENGRVIMIDGENNVTECPDGFEIPAPERPKIEKRSDLKTSAENAAYGREYGFTARKFPEIPALLELQ